MIFSEAQGGWWRVSAPGTRRDSALGLGAGVGLAAAAGIARVVKSPAARHCGAGMGNGSGM